MLKNQERRIKKGGRDGKIKGREKRGKKKKMG
jgi:hypothetical protein